MSATEDPFISPDVTVPELTVRVLGVGIVLGVLMTAANAYLGLYAGMTVSASIPAAVMSMIILRLMFNDVTILENNSVQTMASAGESLAAGVIFTVPAFLVVGLWTDINWGITLAIALLGGWLGTMFTIALRRLFIVEEALPYPEGVACREVLVAGEEGGDGMVAILYALGIGALYGFVVKVMAAVHHAVEGAVEFLGTRLYAGADLSVALFSVGFIVGLRIASFIFLGGVIGFGILTPIYGFVHGWPEGDLAAGFTSIFLSQIRYIGVGAMVVGGVHTLWTMRKTIIDGLSGAFKATDGEAERLLRTEQDIPLRYVAMVVAGLVVLTFLFYWSTTGSLVLALAGALFLALVAFFFSAVAGYIAGVVGSSNSPVSGMTIATMLFTVLLVWVVGDLILNLATEELILATLLIAAVVASSSAIAGDVMQDLKTGNMVGATPWRQQTAEVVGVTVGALVIGPVLSLLHNAFRISATACLDNPLPSDPTCSRALFAPQAELIGAIAEGAFGGSINIQMVMLGVLFAIASDSTQNARDVRGHRALPPVEAVRAHHARRHHRSHDGSGHRQAHRRRNIGSTVRRSDKNRGRDASTWCADWCGLHRWRIAPRGASGRAHRPRCGFVGHVWHHGSRRSPLALVLLLVRRGVRGLGGANHAQGHHPNAGGWCHDERSTAGRWTLDSKGTAGSRALMSNVKG